MAFAQQQTTQTPDQQQKHFSGKKGESHANAAQQGQSAGSQAMTADMADPQHAERWVGKPLTDVTGHELGTVSEVITSQGKISYVLVKTQGDGIHPVPAQHIYTGAEGQKLQATFERRHFEQSPGFTAEQAKQMKPQDWEQEVQGYYGQTERQQNQERK